MGDDQQWRDQRGRDPRQDPQHPANVRERLQKERNEQARKDAGRPQKHPRDVRDKTR